MLSPACLPFLPPLKLEAKEYIVIKGAGSISPLGYLPTEIQESYRLGKPCFKLQHVNNLPVPVAALSETAEDQVESLRQENRFYKNLDRTAILAIISARQAIRQAGWATEKEIAVNIGSSRGATGLFEKYHDAFLTQPDQLPPHVSPSTTLGNISSWVANDLETEGPVISHSVTCSTALQAIGNGFAWLRAGMADRFLAGGAEAPLTPFTIAQMQAIGIYSKTEKGNFWCRPLSAEKQNTFTLGEGAAIFALEKVSLPNIPPGVILLEGLGFGFEKIKSITGISAEGGHFQKAMRQAIAQLPADDQTIDAVVVHAPGTVAGDQAEMNAIKAVFGDKIPLLTSNKLLIGHTLGASAALSLEYAINMLQNQHHLSFPYPVISGNKPGNIPFRRIMLVSAGFGGNAAVLVVRKYSGS